MLRLRSLPKRAAAGVAAAVVVAVGVAVGGVLVSVSISGHAVVAAAVGGVVVGEGGGKITAARFAVAESSRGAGASRVVF